MEGATNTTGKLDGTITDPGKLSGGMREFLLSDRWFSWGYPIESEIGLQSFQSIDHYMSDFLSLIKNGNS